MTAADLSPVDRDILEQLLAGKTAKQLVAHRCPGFATHRVKNLKKRVGVRTSMQLGYWAALQGVKPKTRPADRESADRAAASDPQSFAGLRKHFSTELTNGSRRVP